MLNWRLDDEAADRSKTCWMHPSSNIVLDIHGDPSNAQLTVFSDGNHHMALRECMESLRQSVSGLDSIAYLTLPPPLLRRLLDHPTLLLGNLRLTLKADMIISPLPVLAELCQLRRCREPIPFAGYKGCALLVTRTNPKNIKTYNDLFRDDVTLFLSNPDTEWVSHRFYRDFLHSQLTPAARASFDLRLSSGEKLVIGECIHHREAPLALAEGACDVAILYRHLAIHYQKTYPHLFDLIVPPTDSDKLPPSQPTAVAVVDDKSGVTRQALEYFLSPACKGIYERHELIAM